MFLVHDKMCLPLLFASENSETDDEKQSEMQGTNMKLLWEEGDKFGLDIKKFHQQEIVTRSGPQTKSIFGEMSNCNKSF